jgi:hypothetical protein
MSSTIVALKLRRAHPTTFPRAPRPAIPVAEPVKGGGLNQLPSCHVIGGLSLKKAGAGQGDVIHHLVPLGQSVEAQGESSSDMPHLPYTSLMVAFTGR